MGLKGESMSKEIQVRTKMSDRQFGLASFYGVTLDLDCDGPILSGQQSVGLAWEALGNEDCGTPPGLVAIRNEDATNYIEVAMDAAGSHIFAKLLPGDFALWTPHPDSLIYLRAHTGACLTSKVVAATVTPNGYTIHTSADFVTGSKATLEIKADVLNVGVDVAWTSQVGLASGEASWRSVIGTYDVQGTHTLIHRATGYHKFLMAFNHGDSGSVGFAVDASGDYDVAILPRGGVLFLSGNTGNLYAAEYGDQTDSARIILSELVTDGA
jgi:hypothetical protein